jgi:hypothetical protein
MAGREVQRETGDHAGRASDKHRGESEPGREGIVLYLLAFWGSQGDIANQQWVDVDWIDRVVANAKAGLEVKPLIVVKTVTPRKRQVRKWCCGILSPFRTARGADR